MRIRRSYSILRRGIARGDLSAPTQVTITDIILRDEDGNPLLDETGAELFSETSTVQDFSTVRG